MSLIILVVHVMSHVGVVTMAIHVVWNDGQCNTNGTEECDHINGTCYCFDMWSGDLCEIPPCEY